MLLTIKKTKKQVLSDREIGISNYIPISHLNSPNIFETKHGAQGAVIVVKGCPFEVMDKEALARCQKLVANMVLSMSDEFAVYITTYRHKANVYPSGEFKPGFAKDFNKDYQEKFLEKSLYVNAHYITLMIKGSSHKTGKLLHWATKFSQKHHQESFAFFREKQTKKLQQAILEILKTLEIFQPKLLGEIETPQGKRSELLQFLSILVNGEKRLFCYPYQDIATFIPTKRFYVGHDTLEWQGNYQDDSTLAAIISVKQYCPKTQSSIHDQLL